MENIEPLRRQALAAGYALRRLSPTTLQTRRDVAMGHNTTRAIADLHKLNDNTASMRLKQASLAGLIELVQEWPMTYTVTELGGEPWQPPEK